MKDVRHKQTIDDMMRYADEKMYKNKKKQK